MCIPCAAPAVELLPFLFLILAGVLTVLAAALSRLFPAAALVACFAYRWFSGAVLFKPLGESDEKYWAGKHKVPAYARHVRATFRTTLVIGSTTLMAWPVATLITATVIGATLTTAKGVSDYKRVRLMKATSHPAVARKVSATVGPAQHVEPVR